MLLVIQVRKEEGRSSLCWKMLEDDPRQGSLLLPAAAAAIEIATRLAAVGGAFGPLPVSKASAAP